ncbi:sugar ABC transporter ATP-binding protein [Thaumasiovibrio sp. DFM-14]|uniref:sugar ABC transporter ATP-binding protein n=1 Tax=Thaumasiovibrio sp. DFM-14 TaxID=3384792 RepID=UPI0039A11FF3
MNLPLLRAKNICKQFSGVEVLKSVDFELKHGEIHALVGANGAGKSTLIKILTAAHLADSGTVTLEGHPIHCKTPKEASEAGISAVYQEFSLISDLTVAENIFLGHAPKTKRNLVDWASMHKKAHALLQQLDSTIDTKKLIVDLSVAERQIVEIAKALSYQSKVLIMDEPTSSLSEKDVQKLFNVMRRLAAGGMGIVYVSHRLEELPQIAQRVTVYRDGRFIKTLSIEQAPKSEIIRQMVGDKVAVEKHIQREVGEVFFEAKSLRSEGAFEDVSFELHRGEIFGITGLAGAGRTEMVRALYGADQLESGQLFIEGRPIDITSPRQAISHGIAFITEDRKEEGLVLDHSISDNINLTVLEKIAKTFVIDKQVEHKLSDKLIHDLHIKCNGRSQLAKNLSGGNQQKVVIAKWMATKPKILIMDEPTRGIDVGAKAQIFELLRQLAEDGVGVIMISSEIPEILQYSDRIMVMAEGKVTYTGKNDGTITQEQILNYATMASGKAA